ncbi:MAG: hypothetical protein IKZ19_09190 [Clostridia bacterium]|nr:hypothetical protein [Clostridia bacterium]
MRSDSEPRTIKELGLKSWLSDVLWYHHKGKIIATLVGLLVIFWLITLARSQTKPDITLLLVTGTEVDSEAVDTLESAFASALGDVNGDGEAYVSVTQYVLGSATDAGSVIHSASASVTASFLNNDVVLYLFDEVGLASYNIDDGRFSTELAQRYGGENRAICLSDVPVIRDLLGFNEDYPLYLCIKGETYAYKSSNLTEEEFYGTALKLIDSFFEKYGE